MTVLLMLLCCFSSAFALTEGEIETYRKEVTERPLGERIAFWAEKFVGTPYDPDPLGEYVTRKAIVADERVDCMYLAFRSLELALGRTAGESLIIALDKRFFGKGRLSDNIVLNYEERFQYGEDMIDSGKWGREVTADMGPVSYIKGSRGRQAVGMVSRRDLLTRLMASDPGNVLLRSGDFVFFIKSPEKRVAGEIVGHIGIIKREGNATYLIHAGGKKKGGGSVRKVSFNDYLSTMPFAGIRVTRFD